MLDRLTVVMEQRRLEFKEIIKEVATWNWLMTKQPQTAESLKCGCVFNHIVSSLICNLSMYQAFNTETLEQAKEKLESYINNINS